MTPSTTKQNINCNGGLSFGGSVSPRTSSFVGQDSIGEDIVPKQELINQNGGSSFGGTISP
jgi:hypothetical protein